PALTAVGQLGLDPTFRIGLDIGLSDRVTTLVHRRKINDLVGDLAIDDLAVRALDKSVLVDAGISCQAVDQPDVRTLRCLDRASPAVMCRMHVAHLEAG